MSCDAETQTENLDDEFAKYTNEFADAMRKYFVSTIGSTKDMNNITINHIMFHFATAWKAYHDDPTMPGLSIFKKEKKYQKKLLINGINAYGNMIKFYKENFMKT